MLSHISVEALSKRITEDKPYWPEAATVSKAKELIEVLDAGLEPSISAWVQNGSVVNMEIGEFSIQGIMDGCGCGYLAAVELLNGYIAYPEKGRRAILFYR